MRAAAHVSGRRTRAALTTLLAGGCAVVLAVSVPAQAGTGPAGPASARPADAGLTSTGPASTGAGTISTLAGGTGAPGPSQRLAVLPCGLRVNGTTLYVSSHNYSEKFGRDTGAGSVEAIDTATGQAVTVAGNGAVQVRDGGGNGAVATQVSLIKSCGTAVDAAGNLIVANGDTVQVVAAKTGTYYGQNMTAGHIYRVAGQPGESRLTGVTGEGGPATATQFYNATGVSVDAAGNLVIADSGAPVNCEGCSIIPALVWVVAAKTGTYYGQNMTAGHIYRVAGSYSDTGPAQGNRGSARKAFLGEVIGAVQVDAAGNLVIPVYGADNYFMDAPSYVRVVAGTTGTFYGQNMTAGHIYRVAGNGQRGGSANGGPAREASLAGTDSLSLDAAGNLVLADANQVRVVAEHTGTYYGQAMTTGHIYGIAGTADAGYSGDGGPATAAEVIARDVAVDSHGNVVLAGGGRVRVIAEQTGTFYGQAMTTGDIYRLAGNGRFYSASGTPAAETQFSYPTGAAVDTRGDVLTVDLQHCLVWFGAGRSRRVFGRNVTAGDYYRAGGNGACLRSGAADTGVPARQATLGYSSAASFDHWGNVVVADGTSQQIQVIAASSGTFYGQAMTAGDIYTVAGKGGSSCPSSGTPALQDYLGFLNQAGTDQAGNLLVADSQCDRVWVIAATTGTFYGQAMTAGDLYAIAGDGAAGFSGDGGPALEAGMDPGQAVTDAAGNVVIDDWANYRIRVVAEHTGTFYGQAMTAGDIYTIAGNGTAGFSGNGGPATAAELGSMVAVAVGPHGNLAIADDKNDVIWVVAGQTGTFYGQAMTTGDIYVVAGGGTSLGTDGLGDGGPATAASLVQPDGVAARPDGDLVISDSYANRLRTVSG